MACNKALVLMITLNILFFTLVSSTYAPPPKPSTPPPVSSTPPPKPSTPPPKPSTPPPKPSTPPPVTSTPPPKPSTPPPKPSTPPPVSPNSCPIDTLKLGVCANLLTDLLKLVIGTPSKSPCCQLISGLVDLEAAVCLCTALKAQVLGINLNVPISLSLLINACGKKVPSGFQCAN